MNETGMVLIGIATTFSWAVALLLYVARCHYEAKEIGRALWLARDATRAALYDIEGQIKSLRVEQPSKPAPSAFVPLTYCGNCGKVATDNETECANCGLMFKVWEKRFAPLLDENRGTEPWEACPKCLFPKRSCEACGETYCDQGSNPLCEACQQHAETN